MRLNGLDLNLLVFLEALLIERSVTRAGERLNLSQSSASGALSRLRDHFEDDLMVQSGRRMVPTALALRLEGPVGEALLLLRSALNQRPSFDPATAERSFQIMASDYAVQTLVAEVQQRLTRLAPHVSLRLCAPCADDIESFAHGALDLMILPRSHALNSQCGQGGQHPHEQLFEDELVCIASQDNPHIGPRLDLATFLALGHVIVRFGQRRTPMFEELHLPAQVRPRRIERTIDRFDAVPALVAGSPRIAVVHARTAQSWATRLPLRVLPLPFEMPPIVEVMQWHGCHATDPGHLWLRGVVRTCAEALSLQGEKAPPAIVMRNRPTTWVTQSTSAAVI